MDMKKELDVITHELADIEQEATTKAHAHLLTGRKWEKITLWLGIPATILAALAGVSAFSELAAWITAIVSILVAVLTALTTFLSPSDRAMAHRAAKVTFDEIRRESSLLKDVEVPLSEVKEGEEVKNAVESLIVKLRELSTKLTNTDQSAPTISVTALEKVGMEVEKAQI